MDEDIQGVPIVCARFVGRCDSSVCGQIVAILLAFIAGAAFQPSRAAAADLLEVTKLFRTGHYVECVTEADKAIAANDFSENYRLLKIRAELELGRYADALKTLDEALRAVLKPGDVLVTMGAGTISAVSHALPGKLGAATPRRRA
jgi:hypothetical protein